jgi:peptidoglycan/LPS O-acetylase OafA/YrhL
LLFAWCGREFEVAMSRLIVNQASTAADILHVNKGVGPGFDALRLLLSVWVFTLHAILTCLTPAAAEELAANPLHRILISPVLPMFFAVSGYLVAGSAIRTKSVSTFLLFRALRIAPALFVEVTLSAMILGPCLTETTLVGYFSDPLFFRYFLNVIGRFQWYLPGLFAQNPIPGIVNMNLWTLAPEFFCYVFITVMIVSKVIFSRTYLTLVGFLIFCVAIAYMIFRGGHFYNAVAVVDWKVLILAFIVGCVAFHWNDRIIISDGNAMIAAVIACVVLAYLPSLIIPGLLALTYIVIYIGTRRLYLPSYLRNGDYSYGIYLFGFPLQQTLVYFLPFEYRNGAIVLLVGLPFTLVFAMLSWNLVEKPTLRLKARFKPGYSAASQPEPHMIA